MVTKFIGGDAHCRTTELAVDREGEIIRRFHVATTIPALRKALAGMRGRRVLVFEEGPMAGWLQRNLRSVVDEVIVCDPYHNALIKVGDKDDRIDAGKLATLARGGYLREVHHNDDEQRVLFKEIVSLYHDRVRESVRQINKIYGRGKLWGVMIPAAVRDPARRKVWLGALHCEELAMQLGVLFPGYDAVAAQVKHTLSLMRKQARDYPILKLWCAVPGIQLIRAATLMAYLDTPWRFGRPNRLWKYCGLGLERKTSGTDRHGRAKPAQVHLAWRVNKRLKDAIVGAATSAIQCASPFAAQYRQLLGKGVHRGNAKRTVARKLLLVLWSMWKHQRPYDPALL